MRWFGKLWESGSSNYGYFDIVVTVPEQTEYISFGHVGSADLNSRYIRVIELQIVN